MRKLLLFVCLLAFASINVSGQKKQAQKEGGYDVYLFMGQSNMAGRGYMIEADTINPIDGVWLLNPNGEPEPARNPLNKYSSIRKEYKIQRICPAYSFAKKIHEKTGRKILLVVNARGGTNISQWKHDNEKTKYYAEAVRRAKEAMEYGDLKGIIWHQGESDSDPKNLPLYMDRLSEFVAHLRKDLGKKDVFFVAGELAYWRNFFAGFNKEIRTISEHIKNSDYISADGAGQLIDNIDPHFSREGQILLGERYADKVLKKVYKQNQ